MNVSLTRELEQFIQGKVESGLYNNASEVIREGLRLLKEQDEARRAWREQIERGWQQAQGGQVVDGPHVLAALKRRVKARTKNAPEPGLCTDAGSTGQPGGDRRVHRAGQRGRRTARPRRAGGQLRAARGAGYRSHATRRDRTAGEVLARICVPRRVRPSARAAPYPRRAAQCPRHRANPEEPVSHAWTGDAGLVHRIQPDPSATVLTTADHGIGRASASGARIRAAHVGVGTI